jgi:hypothetical protein
VGTFHQDKGELHGITVVVTTDGPELFVGRCDTVTPTEIVLLDVEAHVEGTSPSSRDEYLRRVAMVGQRGEIPRVVVPTDRLRSLTYLPALLRDELDGRHSVAAEVLLHAFRAGAHRIFAIIPLGRTHLALMARHVLESS